MSDQNLDVKENKFKSFFITNQKRIFLLISAVIIIFLDFSHIIILKMFKILKFQKNLIVLL